MSTLFLRITIIKSVVKLNLTIIWYFKDQAAMKYYIYHGQQAVTKLQFQQIFNLMFLGDL